MCLLAKINNREFMCFYKSGNVELRDEHFQSEPLPKTDKVLVKQSSKSDWCEISAESLKKLTETQMEESLRGLKILALS